MLKISIEQDVAVVSFDTPSISGISDVDRIRKELAEFIAVNRPERLVIDFDGVKFFSSQMLGILVDTWRKVKEYGGVVAVSGVVPQLYRVFKITNLDKIFEFYPDKKSAVEAMGAKR